MKTKYNCDISRELVANKLEDMVGQFYKILPLKESGTATFTQYTKSLMREWVGLKELICFLHDDSIFARLLGMLQFMIDNDCDTSVIRADVFNGIGLIKKLQKKLGDVEDD